MEALSLLKFLPSETSNLCRVDTKLSRAVGLHSPSYKACLCGGAVRGDREAIGTPTSALLLYPVKLSPCCENHCHRAVRTTRLVHTADKTLSEDPPSRAR